MRTVWSFHIAHSIVFGRDAVKQLGEIATRMRAKKALIVTDAILEKAGLLERVRQPLLAAGLTVDAFTGGEPEPSMRAGLACYEQAKTFQPDLLIGLGGGSNMDLAKLAATLLKHGGGPRDYVGDDKIPGPVFPLICIPTTAGTGSEVSAATVITDNENHIKVGILSNWLRPTVAVVDPLMTVSCPPKVTADSGIDALTHAIEAFTAIDNADFPLPEGERTVYQGKHPMGDLCAERAITLIGKYLCRAVKDGSDLEAREGMALAALLAGMAFSNVGVALVHAMEYPVGGAVHCSHGVGNGLLLPYVMRFNLSAKVKAFAEIAALLGENVTGLTERAAAEKAIAAVEKLRADIGIPQRLRDLGVKQEQLRGLAEKTFGIKRILRVNPRSVTVEEIEGIFQEAL
ncbi:MAG: iron-containing alcohol dehydrogenase [Planctomycetes bacterium]|nr:iron-containing alcohol dehydrogenase [Planctomycetota bacterium]